MSDSVICGQCGEPITGEVPGLELAERKPCPKCGSTSRTYGVEIPPMTISSSVTVQATVITYPHKLLTLARRLIDDGEFGIAVVVAHMACEIATERTLSEAFVGRGIPYLEDSVTDFLSGYTPKATARKSIMRSRALRASNSTSASNLIIGACPGQAGKHLLVLRVTPSDPELAYITSSIG